MGVESVDLAALATAFRDGDESALRAAYDAWGGMVHRYCSRVLRSSADADDVTQQVFVAAWNARSRYRPEQGELPAWLLGIARHKTVDRLRGDARLPTPVSALPEGAASTPEMEHLEDRLLIADALRRLPDEQRSALELAFFEGLSHERVAARLGVPLGTAKSHIRRGLERLRRVLPAEPQGGAA